MFERFCKWCNSQASLWDCVWMPAVWCVIVWAIAKCLGA